MTTQAFPRHTWGSPSMRALRSNWELLTTDGRAACTGRLAARH